jgi:cytochrome c oxidase subunit IV
MLILEMVYDIVLPPLIVNVLEKSPIVFMVEDWSVIIPMVDG